MNTIEELTIVTPLHQQIRQTEAMLARVTGRLKRYGRLVSEGTHDRLKSEKAELERKLAQLTKQLTGGK